MRSSFPIFGEDGRGHAECGLFDEIVGWLAIYGIARAAAHWLWYGGFE
jgi:hypothetical protein